MEARQDHRTGLNTAALDHRKLNCQARDVPPATSGAAATTTPTLSKPASYGSAALAAAELPWYLLTGQQYTQEVHC
jgi:hypothetical protein